MADVKHTPNEPCGTCGADVRVHYGPDIRFNPPRYNPMMYRAECSGDCLNPSWTAFTHVAALDMWNEGMRSAAIAKAIGGAARATEGSAT